MRHLEGRWPAGHGTRLDARNSVESGAILPDRLGALGPTVSEPENRLAQPTGRPFDSIVYPGRCGMKRPSGNRPVRPFGPKCPG